MKDPLEHGLVKPIFSHLFEAFGQPRVDDASGPPLSPSLCSGNQIVQVLTSSTSPVSTIVSTHQHGMNLLTDIKAPPGALITTSKPRTTLPRNPSVPKGMPKACHPAQTRQKISKPGRPATSSRTPRGTLPSVETGLSVGTRPQVTRTSAQITTVLQMDQIRARR